IVRQWPERERKMRFAVKAFALIACAGLSPQARAAEPIPHEIALVYTNVCYNRQGGDLIGVEITLLRLPDGDKVVVRWAEGIWENPVVADADVDQQSGTLSFTTPDQTSFSGKISGDRMAGKFRRNGKVTTDLDSGAFGLKDLHRVRGPHYDDNKKQ